MRSLSLKRVGALLAAGWLLFFPALSLGRGMGHDFFLLSPEGKLICQLGSQYSKTRAMDWVDSKNELVYRWDSKKLNGTDFAAKQLWTYTPPTGLGWHTGMDGGSGVLTLIRVEDNWRAGIDPKTGKELYRIALEDAVPPSTSMPAIEESSGASGYQYYLGRDGPPHHLIKLDLRTGKHSWKKALPAKIQQFGELRYVANGSIRWEKGLYCFDPDTGTELTQIPTDFKGTRQVFFHPDGVFHLSKDSPAVLTVYEPKTWKKLWSIEGLAGVYEMAAPFNYGRLLCKADNTLYVIDTKQQKLLAKISHDQIKFDYSFCYQTEKSLLVLCQGEKKNTLACWSLPLGKILWSRTTGPVDAKSVAIHGDRVVVVEPNAMLKAGPGVPQGRQLAPPLTALSLEDGKEIWRWQVPQLANHFYDSLHANVEACKSGFIVTRTWIVLD